MRDGTPMDSIEVANDEEEENRHGHAATQELTKMTTTSSEYKSANMMLRELHILNQHRLMFSAPTPAAPAPLPLNSFSMTREPSLIRHLPYALPHMSSKLHPTPSQADQLPRTYSLINKFTEQYPCQAGPMEEPSVSEKYENINK